MLESSDLVAFVAATDLRQARAFYEQTLGLELTARGVTFLRYEGMSQEEHGIWTAPGGAQVA